MAIRHEVALAPRGLLRAFNQAQVLGLADAHTAHTLGRLFGEADDRVLLATALAVRALREGSVCLRLDRAAADFPADVDEAAGTGPVFAVVEDPATATPTPLDWPDPTAWTAALLSSPMVAVGEDASRNQRPLRLVDGQVYLERYWIEQEAVLAVLTQRLERPGPVIDETVLTASLDEFFPPADVPDGMKIDWQRQAAEVAARSWTSVLAGGPGTGKTTTVGKLLVTLADQVRDQDRSLRIALAAPTGKAAGRLTETLGEFVAKSSPDRVTALGGLTASTLHQLLGWRGSSGFVRGPRNRLPHDVVVVDEASMVGLSLMSQLLHSVRPDARVILIGDPDQLASVEAGAVLADIVDADPPSHIGAARPAVVTLQHNYRNQPAIKDLAAAIRQMDSARALEVLADTDPAIEFWAGDAARYDLGEASALRSILTEQAQAMRRAAMAGNSAAALAALDQHRLLCAHRSGSYGVARWIRLVETELRRSIHGYASEGEWYWGRPILINQTDRALGVVNGDTGVLVKDVSGQARVAIGQGRAAPLLVPPYSLDGVQSLHAMTIHKSQGSQFDWVTVVLPPPGSPLLTRQLLYTAVTRAQTGVRVIGHPESVALAVATPARRASGLTERLRRKVQFI